MRIFARLAETALTLLGASLLVFLFAGLGADELARQMAAGGEDRPVTAAEIAAAAYAAGLDDPLPLRYVRWLEGVLQGDLGMSWMMRAPVSSVLLSRLPATAALCAASLLLTLLVSIPLGLLAARFRGRGADRAISFFSFLGLSLPGFWLGLLLLRAFGLSLGLLPILAGTGGPAALVLPAATLAAGMSAKYIRQVRAAALEELGKDYVMGARARGMTETRILLREVFPHIAVFLLPLLALSLASLLSGTAAVEIVFGWPGLGSLAADAVAFRDIRLLEGLVLWGALWTVLARLAADAAARFLDPRLRGKEPRP